MPLINRIGGGSAEGCKAYYGTAKITNSMYVDNGYCAYIDIVSDKPITTDDLRFINLSVNATKGGYYIANLAYDCVSKMGQCTFAINVSTPIDNSILTKYPAVEVKVTMSDWTSVQPNTYRCWIDVNDINDTGTHCVYSDLGYMATVVIDGGLSSTRL